MADATVPNITDESTTLNSTCVLPADLPDSVHPSVDHIRACIVFLTMICGVTMNAFVIYIIAKHRVLHKMAFFLALQVIVAHLIFSSTVLPFMFVTSVLREWRLGVVMCQVLGTIHDVVITSRYLLTFVLTIDRIISVFFPFYYFRRGTRIAVVTSLLAWSISVLRAVTSLKGILNCTHFVPTFRMCTGAAFCSELCKVHTVVFSTILALFGVFIPSLLYVMLFCKAKIITHQLKKLRPARGQKVSPLGSLGTSASPEPSVVIKDEDMMDQEVERHNNRANITFLILIAVIIGFALPPYIIYVAQNILGTNHSPVVTILQIIVGRTLIYSLAVADPIIIMRNRDVKELLKSIFRKSSSTLSSSIS